MNLKDNETFFSVIRIISLIPFDIYPLKMICFSIGRIILPFAGVVINIFKLDKEEAYARRESECFP
ncbi:hypothetical protein C1N70_00415 [Cytobacillus firmus]